MHFFCLEIINNLKILQIILKISMMSERNMKLKSGDVEKGDLGKTEWFLKIFRFWGISLPDKKRSFFLYFSRLFKHNH